MQINVNRTNTEIEVTRNQTNISSNRKIVYEADHTFLSNRDSENQHPISAITGLQEALDSAGKVEDVKVDGASVVDGNKIANIIMPTIPTKTSDLTNDSGFIDKEVDDLTNYTKTADLPDGQTIVDVFSDLPTDKEIGTIAIVLNDDSSQTRAPVTHPVDGDELNNPQIVETPPDFNDMDNYFWLKSDIDGDDIAGIVSYPVGEVGDIVNLIFMNYQAGHVYLYSYSTGNMMGFDVEQGWYDVIMDGETPSEMIPISFDDVIQLTEGIYYVNDVQDSPNFNMCEAVTVGSESLVPKGQYQYNGTEWNYLPYNIIKNDGDSFKFLNENGNYILIPIPNIPVQDVKVNGTSVVDNTKIAQIAVPTTANEVGATPERPNGVNELIARDTGKINTIYLPPASVGGLVNGGNFNQYGTIIASTYCPELTGVNIDVVAPNLYPNFYFIATGEYSFLGTTYNVGDWAISNGIGWTKLNSTDAVTSVNGKLGTVVLNHRDVGASKAIVTETFTVENWNVLSGKSPFTASAVIIPFNTIGENTVLSLGMNLVKQATYGIGIGSVVSNTVTLYALTTPEEPLTIDLIMED